MIRNYLKVIFVGIFLIFVGGIEFCNAVCSNQSVAFSSNSSAGTTSFRFVTHSSAVITMEYQCFSGYVNNAGLYWLKTGQNITTGRKLGDIYYLRFPWSWRFTKGDSGSDILLTSTSSSYGIQLYLTIYAINSSHHNSQLLLMDGNSTIQNVILQVDCCRSTSIPSYLELNSSWTEEDPNCLDTGIATCKSNSMFLKGGNNVYKDNVSMECMVYGRWNDPGVECLSSCPFPQQTHLYVKTYPRSSKRYKVGTVLTMGCPSGRMHSAVSPTHFIAETQITCQTNEKWTDDVVACWTGQVVDFTAKAISLLSGQATIFTCKARQPLNAVLDVDGLMTNENERVWANITMTPEHNGITASCKEIDSFNIRLYEEMTYLNVQYEPELTGKTETNYEFSTQSSNYIAIRFRANPILHRSDIRVTKNGSALSNFYLTVNGTDHEAVLHFTKVSASDGGNYIVSLQSYWPVANILQVNLTIDVRSPTHQLLKSPGDVAAVALAALLIIAVVVMVITFVKLKREQRGSVEMGSKNSNISPVYDPSDDGQNYEDVSDPPKDKKLSVQKGNYEDMTGRKGNENPYVQRMKKGLPPPVQQRPARYVNYRNSAASVDSFDDDPIYDNE